MEEKIKFNMIFEQYFKEFGLNPKIAYKRETNSLIIIKMLNNSIIDSEINKLEFICKSKFNNYFGYGIIFNNNELLFVVMLKCY